MSSGDLSYLEDIDEKDLCLLGEDVVDEEVFVRVFWVESGEFHRYFLNPKDTVSVIIKDLKSKMGVSDVRMTRTENENIIEVSEDETIDKLDLTGVKFLTATNAEKTEIDITKASPNCVPITIKGDGKKTYTYYLGKNKTFEPILIELRTVLKMPEGRIKLMFDGVEINISKDTPKDLEMEEDGNCVDLYL